MTYSISLSDDAIRDLDESFIWYETQSLGLGEKFIDTIDEGLDIIKEYPQLFTVVKKTVRRMVIKKFPFNIYFKINKNDGQIQVIRILHHKRKQKW